MATQLEIIAEQQRQQHLSTNQYNYNQLYDSNNLNALSSNDEKGKGELNGNIGSKKDILERNSLLSKNLYNNKFFV